MSYDITDSTEIGVDWLYGRSFGGNISFELDPTADPFPQKVGLPVPPPMRTPKQQQEALNLMLDDRKGVTVSTYTFTTSNMLADALWQSDVDPNDIAIHGSTLVVSVSSGDLSKICRGISTSVSLYSLIIISVNVFDGHRSISCSAAATPALALIGSKIQNDVSSEDFSTIAKPVNAITIDASIEPSPDIEAAIRQIRKDVGRQKITIQAINISGAEVVVYYSNTTYLS